MRHMTNDRGPPEIPIFTVKEVGQTRKLLPNGSLLCEAVPIARVGWMLYGPGEVPLSPGTTGTIYVERSAEELFRPETIGSFMACPIVNDHPSTEEGVTPENWRELAGGFTTTNVRRGEGPDSDVLLADLIITRKDLIEAVQQGKVEVSCGYDADYIQTAPGEGRQCNIIGNHIALVDKGRCGPRCAIGDHATITSEGESMPKPQAGARKRRTIDEAALEGLSSAIATAVTTHLGASDDDEVGDVHVHVHTGDADPEKKDDDPSAARFEKIEKTLDAVCSTVSEMGNALKAMSTDRRKNKDAEGDPGPDDGPDDEDDDVTQDGKGKKKGKDAEGDPDDKGDDKGDKKKTEDGKGKTEDSAALSRSYQDMVSKAEVLVPGFKTTTFDAASPRKMTVDRMCQQRRRVLDEFNKTQDGAAIVASITGEDACDLASMDCATLAVTFNAAAAQKAANNNRAATGDSGRVPANPELSVHRANATVSVADINKANEAFWAGNASKP